MSHSFNLLSAFYGYFRICSFRVYEYLATSSDMMLVIDVLIRAATRQTHINLK